MITFIEGILEESSAVRAVVNIQGIGYEVNIPLTTADILPKLGKVVKLHTLAVYREDSAALYGFSTKDDRDFYKLLVEKVSGIGPKTALSILSKLSVASLKSAIANSDVSLLSKCPGIGKKTAERIIIELRDKHITTVAAPGSSGSNEISSGQMAVSTTQDAVAALIALGYKPNDADKAIQKAQAKLGSDATTEALIRASLGSS